MLDKSVNSITPKGRKQQCDVHSLTPASALSALSIDESLASARKALHDVTELPCREKELKELEDFILGHLKNESSGSMYISGLPGTGKTASLSQVILNENIKKGYHIVFVNCTAVKSSGSVYLRICEQLKIKTGATTEKGAANAIDKYLARKHKMVLLVLDEIDQLESKYQSILYRIFEWPSRKKSRIVLIGIANAVDLTDRKLPRLYAEIECKPTLLHFAPYTKEEISTILKHRLSKVGEIDLFAPGALELISAKVAGQSGDVRRALDLGRRVLEMSRTPSTRNSSKKQTDNKESQANTVPTRQRKSQRQLFPDNDETPPPLSPIKPRKLWEDKSSPAAKGTGTVLEENVQRTPVKTLTDTPRKRKLGIENTEVTPQKTPRKLNLNDGTPSKACPRVLGQSEVNILSPARQSPRRLSFISPSKKSVIESPLKVDSSPIRRMSPRKKNVVSPVKEPFSIKARDVLQVVNSMHGTARTLKTEESAFPLHQKLLICTMMLILRKAKNRDVTVGKLHEVYSRVCTKRGITPVDQSGFIFICRQVEMTGAVTVGKGPAKLAKITLQWDETEVAHALQDSSLLAAILADTSSLSK